MRTKRHTRLLAAPTAGPRTDWAATLTLWALAVVAAAVLGAYAAHVNGVL